MKIGEVTKDVPRYQQLLKEMITQVIVLLFLKTFIFIYFSVSLSIVRTRSCYTLQEARFKSC
jgi:hypothetical protein